MIKTDKIRARDGAGLALYEDGGAGIFVKDGGNVGISTTTPGGLLALTATTKWIKPGTNTLSAAAAAAADGDVLFLMAGTYTQTEAITITSKALSIFGAGVGISVINCTGCHGIDGNTNHNNKCITLMDFSICTTNAGGYNAIQLTGGGLNSAKQFHIERVYAKPYYQPDDYWSRGIKLTDGTDSKIIACNFRGKNQTNTGMLRGIELAGFSTNVQMVANQFIFMEYAMYITGTTEGVLISDSIVVYAKYGVEWNCAGYEPLLKVSGCHFDCFNAGIRSNAPYSQIANNMILRREGAATFIGIDFYSCDYVSITGNVLPIGAAAQTDIGIRLNDCSYCTVMGNIMIGCDRDILLSGTTTHCAVVGNVGNGSIHHIDDEGTTNFVLAANSADADFSGKVGICTAAPANPLAVNRQADDGTVVDIEQADTVEGTISVSGNTVSYNAFMGAHFTQLKKGQKVPPIGAIVIATGEIVPCEVHTKPKTKKRDVSGVERKEYFSYIELTPKQADSRVYGVYHAKMSEDAKGQSFGEDNEPIHQIAALGLYKVRVTDTNGNINEGCYIQSSVRSGEGEKQNDDILHSYTVAKAIIDVDWDEVIPDSRLGYKWKLIPATLHCG
jgi:hypothetical protein